MERFKAKETLFVHVHMFETESRTLVYTYELLIIECLSFQVDPGTHTVRHDSPISVFGGFMYGTARYETYGMPLGMRLAPINKVRTHTL